MIGKVVGAVAFLVAFAVAPANQVARDHRAGAVLERSTHINGVTVDTTRHLTSTVASLTALPGRQWTRIVLDIDGRHPASVAPYRQPVRRLAATGPVMAELADSSELRRVGAATLARRATAFIKAVGPNVALWEIGNEVNGNWTGPPAVVAHKVVRTYRAVRHRGGATALTLYENHGCGDGPHELSPTAWSKAHLPTSLRRGLDDVFLSYYEGQCHGNRPSVARWRARFTALHALFPNAKVGFGEIGMPHPATPATRSTAASIVRYYYRLDLGLPYFVGGDFYWYYAEDMVPWRTSPLWHVLRHAIAQP